MTLLIDFAHMILAAALSFLGLGYERAQDPRAVQMAPHEIREEIEGALLNPAALSVSVQNAQSLCSPALMIQAGSASSEDRTIRTTAQIIILNDCETIPSRPALPTL
ncbi:hypothetical protein ACFELO_04190 [Oceanicaulis sp. LC35]|uniref:hypothetical protein n=1 Tax=Oceanicaulis sp. LC35 TaxID=3349635 RepID=UPI003F82CEEF